jgi:hypothetical protein
MMNESAGCFGICAQHPQDIRPCHHSPDHFGSLMETSGHTWRGEEDILSSADGETNVTLRFGEHPGISLPLSHLVLRAPRGQRPHVAESPEFCICI